MSFFFYVTYALVVALVSAAFGAALCSVACTLLPTLRRSWPLVPLALALAWWIWAGWVSSAYDLGRPGLAVFAAVSAAAFVRGWRYGLVVATRIRSRAQPRRRERGHAPSR